MASVLLNIPTRNTNVISSLCKVGYNIIRSTATTTTLHFIVKETTKEPNVGDVIKINDIEYITHLDSKNIISCENCDVWKNNIDNNNDNEICQYIHCTSRERKDGKSIYFIQK